MKLYGEVEIRNLLVASVDTRPNRRASKACLTIGKKSAKDSSGLLQICTNSNKIGTNYKLQNNVEKVFNKFVHEGKCTIRTKDPHHEILISKADPVSLKSFLVGVKCCMEGRALSQGNLGYLTPASTSELSCMKTKMTILSKSEYPVTESFPSRLEQLSISCGLRCLDTRILSLKHLTTLDLANNSIRKMPDNWESMVMLSYLNLSDNLIEIVPKNFVSSCLRHQLTFLDLSRNQLSSLPHAICEFDKLLELKVSGNRLTRLPQKIFRMLRLQNLNASDNQLDFLPGGSDYARPLEAINVCGNEGLVGPGVSAKLEGLERIPSLEELSSRAVLNKRVKYSENDLPSLVRFSLEVLSRSCLFCGKYCIDFSACVVRPTSLSKFSRSSFGVHTVQMEYFLCSPCCWLAEQKKIA